MTERPKRTARSTLAFAGITVLAIFGPIEGIVRIREWRLYGTPERAGTPMYVPSPEKDVGHTLRPGFDAQGSSLQIHVNALGWRGRELAVPKPRGTVRVVCIGGSTTFDTYAANDDAAWPARLERKLREKHPSVETVNAGVPGWTVDSYLAPSIWGSVTKLEPDWVMNYFATNEISKEAQQRFAVAKEGPSWSGRLLETLTDWSLFLYKVRLFVDSRNPPPEQAGTHDLPDDAVHGFEEKLHTLVAREKALGARVALGTFALRWRADQPAETKKELAKGCYSIYPGLSLDGIERAFSAYNEAIARVAAKDGCVLVPVAPALSGNKELFGDYVHFSAEGSERMAEVVARALEDAHVLAPAEAGSRK